jgi:hypothetical protein
LKLAKGPIHPARRGWQGPAHLVPEAAHPQKNKIVEVRKYEELYLKD